MSSHSRCRIGANACGRSRRASHKPSANRWSTRAQRLARSRLNPEISAAAFPVRSDRRCSQRLAKPRSRGRTQRAHGARQPSKRARPIRSRARCAASRCSSAGAVTARRACRKRGASMDSARSKRLAKRSQRRPPRATIRARSAAVNRARGEAISEGHRRNRSWAREHPGQRDEAWFKREIAPKLDAFTLEEIGKATGLSLAACSRIRAGAKVPHPRHWEACSRWSKGRTRPAGRSRLS